MTPQQVQERRKTSQELPPSGPSSAPQSSYSLYPCAEVPARTINCGFRAIAEPLVGSRVVRIDGFGGVFWKDFREQLDSAFADFGLQPEWVDLSLALKTGSEIDRLANPCLGGNDPLFGTRYEGQLADLFDSEQLDALAADTPSDCTIFYGCGAGLIECDGPLLYVDEQRPDEPSIIAGDDLRAALDRLSQSVFRVRPWFEPGPWGGDWIKEHIPQLPQDVPNYAWSFELITPENGLMFEDGEHFLEVSFDWLMYLRAGEVLGDFQSRFGFDFPIRFNFLDTFDGGNLSIQCHPRTEYIKEHFGEPFTQDECYYIVDSKPGSEVFLGFVEGIDPHQFGAELKRSFIEASEMDVRKFVNSEPTNNHDLFLIPGGTIHSSGVNNLVLEISATTYIFTFKMYDWQRMGLDGKPRPLNIDRALDNLCFERQGHRVAEELISRPRELAHGDDWRLVHLPTHRNQYYDVHRFEFDTEVTGFTEGSPNVMALVEGSSVIIETKDGTRQQFNFAETFVVPAAADSFKIINAGKGRAMVVRAFLKPGFN